jgi:hypothetical protein
MGWARELTAKEKEFLEALGAVVMFWNHVENSMRTLVRRATILGPMEHRAMVVVANLGNVALSDTLCALADDHAVDRANHLRHCAKLFDAERDYRNYYVHGPYTFRSTDDATDGVAASVTTRGGKLRAHSRAFSIEELLKFHDRLELLQKYIGELLQDSIDLRGGMALSDLPKPKLPPKLRIERVMVVAPDKVEATPASKS